LNLQEVITAIEKYENTSRNVVSANLRRLLQSCNAGEIAEKAQIAKPSVYNWTKMRGGTKPTVLTALRVCDVLGVDISELSVPVDISNSEDNRPRCITPGCDNIADAAGGLCWKCYQAKRRAMQFANKK
jgi:DNA-binding phage protein